ncbi:hypothetical protein PVAP13_9KG553826 [Panicum virgatum]|uniref:Uncharacterized protein n=1 Tax=Panicum virgatum TaxID=38727 RepID=A0A8T0NW35_PANVG|nr:hypothetical protein PVAP13_9KG553826 [Panicum virgatum]
MEYGQGGRRKMHKKREMRFNVGAKGFTLYLHTMFGMTGVREGVLVKVTSLYREMWLRIQCRKFSDQFCALKDQGLLSWPAYRARTVLKMTLIYASVIGLAYMIIYL